MSRTFVFGDADTQAALQVSREEVASLAGAPAGSVVKYSLGTSPHTLDVIVNHPAFDEPSVRSLTRQANGKLEVFNHNFKLHQDHQGKGIGTQMLYDQVRAIRRLGGGTIKTVAARGPTMNGYFSWLRMGFDARIPQTIRNILPKEFAGAAKLSHLMKTPQGRSWWKEHGRTVLVEFNTAPNSAASRTLEQYAREKGLK